MSAKQKEKKEKGKQKAVSVLKLLKVRAQHGSLVVILQ